MGKKRPDKKVPSVLIAIPCMNSVYTEFLQSILGLETNGQCRIGIAHNSLVYNARNDLSYKALRQGYDYILWVDSDMVFNSDSLLMLLDDVEKYGMEFVCGLYFKRTRPTEPVLCSKIEWKQNEKGMVEHNVEKFPDYPQNELFEIAGCGFGFVLMKTSLVNDVAQAFRMSPFHPLPYIGEDYSFCWRMAQIGKKMYCDSRVSLGHVGTFIYDEDEYIRQISDPNRKEPVGFDEDAEEEVDEV